MNKPFAGDIPVWISGLIYYGMRAFVALSAIAFLLRGEWEQAASAAAIFMVMLVPGFLQEKYRIRLPLELDAAIVAFIFATLFLGSLGNFYEMFPWWDKMLHFFSGFLLSIIGYVVIYVLNDERMARLKLTPAFAAFFTVCFSSMLSVVWEIYEYSADRFFGFNMQRSGLNDTMGDLILNLCAALMLALIAYFWMRRRLKVPFSANRLSRLQYEGHTKKRAS